MADGTIEGFVGGHCAQNSVRKAAMGVLQAGESVLLRVLPDGDVHFPEAPGACVVVNPCLAGGSLEIFLTPQLPAPLIQIYGETPIADALIELCGLLGYDARREIMVCRYADGVGHPFWFSRTVFGELARLHGDKGVWKLVHSGRHPVRELAVDGCVPLDVDTWDDYRRLLESVPS